MNEQERAEREATFMGAKAAVLTSRPALASGVKVVRMDSHEYVLRTSSGGEAPLGVYEGQFLHLVDGKRTVGEIIELIADDMDIPQAMEAGKAAMSALHVHYVEGAIGELRGLR